RRHLSRVVVEDLVGEVVAANRDVAVRRGLWGCRVRLALDEFGFLAGDQVQRGLLLMAAGGDRDSREGAENRDDNHRQQGDGDRRFDQRESAPAYHLLAPTSPYIAALRDP